MDDGPSSAMAGLRALDQAGITPTAFTLREPSLDDVFLGLTGRRAEDETEDSGDPESKRRGRSRRRAAAETMPVVTGEIA